MTRSEFRTALAQRVAYHEGIGDDRIAGVLRLTLEEFNSVNGVPELVPPPDRLLTLEEGADRLSVTIRWLRETRPAYVVELSPKLLRVSERKLNDWLRRH